jgi:hypothetical protein
MKCPKCKHGSVARLKRHGVMVAVILPLFGRYPWECPLCRKMSLMRSRGDRNKKFANVTSFRERTAPHEMTAGDPEGPA